VSNFASAGGANNPPLTPIEDSPVTVTGATSHTISIPQEDHIEVFFRESEYVSEQVGLRVNGSTDYFYHDITGSRIAPDSSVALPDCSGLKGVTLRISNTEDDYYIGGNVSLATEGGAPPQAPAVAWSGTSGGMDGPIDSFTILNREGTSNIGFTVEVYARP